ncbi:LysR family transcriptional regulator, partial [Enterococcus faecium]
YHAMQEVLETYSKDNNLSLNILTIPTMINYKGFSKNTEFLKRHPEFTVQLKEVESVVLTYNDGNEHSDTIHFARSFQA